MELLYALGAIDRTSNLTEPMGAHMAEIPLHPMFAKALLESVKMGCAEEMLIIAAMSQIQNAFVNPPNEKHKAVRIHCFLSTSRQRHWDVFFCYVRVLLRVFGCSYQYL